MYINYNDTKCISNSTRRRIIPATHDQVENGDLNWIIPGRMLAFATPQKTTRDAEGYRQWTPEDYVPLFKQWGIDLVVRLNKNNTYDRTKFLSRGIKHEDMYFNDGGLPPMELVEQFLMHAESTSPFMVEEGIFFAISRSYFTLLSRVTQSYISWRLSPTCDASHMQE